MLKSERTNLFVILDLGELVAIRRECPKVVFTLFTYLKIFAELF